VTTPPDAEQLRRRAVDLRRLATRLDDSLVPRAIDAGQDDAWRGPTASAFQSEGRRARSLADDATETLCAAARALDRLADEADVAARVAAGATPLANPGSAR